jgi:hypothetical protein
MYGLELIFHSFLLKDNCKLEIEQYILFMNCGYPPPFSYTRIHQAFEEALQVLKVEVGDFKLKIILIYNKDNNFGWAH